MHSVHLCMPTGEVLAQAIGQIDGAMLAASTTNGDG